MKTVLTIFFWNTYSVIFDALSLVKISIESDLPSSRSENHEKREGGTLKENKVSCIAQGYPSMKKPAERFLETSSVFSGWARYSNSDHLTFFPNQKTLLIRCELYKDAAGKAYTQYKHDFSYRDKIDN